MSSDPRIPVIDLFAGPGGLGEGFASLGRAGGRPRFRIQLSIEKDPIAHQTLELRAFFRQFPHRQVPTEYYQHLQGTISRVALFDAHRQAAERARQESWQAELGRIDSAQVRGCIKNAVTDADKSYIPRLA